MWVLDVLSNQLVMLCCPLFAQVDRLLDATANYHQSYCTAKLFVTNGMETAVSHCLFQTQKIQREANFLLRAVFNPLEEEFTGGRLGRHSYGADFHCFFEGGFGLGEQGVQFFGIGQDYTPGQIVVHVGLGFNFFAERTAVFC